MFPKRFWKHYKFPINMIVNMNMDDNTKNIEKLIVFINRKHFVLFFNLLLPP